MNDGLPIPCPGCGERLGVVKMDKKARIIFDDGNMAVIEGYKHCRVCGRMFYWRSRDYQSVSEVPRQFGPAVPAGV